MTNRTIEINGVQLKIERGVEAPPVLRRGREKSPLRLALEQMQPGESAVFPMTPEQMQAKSGTLYQAGKSLGCKFAYRNDGGKARVFCTGTLDGKPAASDRRANSGW